MMDEKTSTYREDTIPLFLSFCIEQYAHQKGIDGKEAMTLLLKSDALKYLQDNYEILHTQSPQWIVEEINEYLSNHA